MLRPVDCEHATPSEKQGTIICAIGKFSGRPHIGTCWACLQGEAEPLIEDPCKLRGKVLTWKACCRGGRRPVAYQCNCPEVSLKISAANCNSRLCKLYS